MRSHIWSLVSRLTAFHPRDNLTMAMRQERRGGREAEAVPQGPALDHNKKYYVRSVLSAPSTFFLLLFFSDSSIPSLNCLSLSFNVKSKQTEASQKFAVEEKTF